MTYYLALLKRRILEKRLGDEPSKPSKGAFEGYEGDRGSGFSRNQSPATCFREIDPADPLEGFNSKRWNQIIQDGTRFLAQWGSSGWSDSDLFGAHPTVPAARFDFMGLVLLIAGGEVEAIESDHAVLRTAGGSLLTYRRETTKSPYLWDLQNLQKGLTDMTGAAPI